jgi:hypothetical protein
VQRGSGSAGTDPSKELQPPKGQRLAAPVGISRLLKLAGKLLTISGNTVVPVENFPFSPDVSRPRRRSLSRIVPPAQDLVTGLWVPHRGIIRQRPPTGGTTPDKPPFTKDGKSLNPVVERCNLGKIQFPSCSLFSDLATQSYTASPSYNTYQATPILVVGKGN